MKKKWNSSLKIYAFYTNVLREEFENNSSFVRVIEFSALMCSRIVKVDGANWFSS